VTDGFYVWQRQGKAKQPYFIHLRDDRPFAFAGLWESWERAGEGPLEMFTILTTEPNALVAPLHDRMPVILPPGATVAERKATFSVGGLRLPAILASLGEGGDAWRIGVGGRRK
jgi:hypothetical protein